MQSVVVNGWAFPWWSIRISHNTLRGNWKNRQTTSGIKGRRYSYHMWYLIHNLIEWIVFLVSTSFSIEQHCCYFPILPACRCRDMKQPTIGTISSLLLLTGRYQRATCLTVAWLRRDKGARSFHFTFIFNCSLQYKIPLLWFYGSKRNDDNLRLFVCRIFEVFWLRAF